ncbi:hypothetical protein NL108_014493 [Boleophthalmus pectinirostris]|uniref:uncharacterized protein LOC110171905 n=1 Tax=Boleophthalmus pectinirostris TaxID=150288 RepID=UPI0024316A25|nr:uncharacterized protein LOC110171905 [Boleophthalmus pectinirostris]KAJ0063971.1 hypothetical protein NL108_014493 [Boleophthalmus pectinirostris]
MANTFIVDIEMVSVPNGNDAAPRVNGQDCIDGPPGRTEESETLLENVGTGNGNAVGINGPDPDPEAQRIPNNQKESVACKIKKELREKVCKVCPLWLVLILILVTVICLVFISLAVCRALYEDIDDKYDPTQFGMCRDFSGSVQLPNFNSSEELPNLTSDGSQSLTRELENKLNVLYRDSPALGRYFIKSQIYEFSDGPVTALFRLMFRMPEEEEGGQLEHFTLSKEMVYNVLRQFLYDQELDPSDHMYIETTSLNISSVVTNKKCSNSILI